MSVKWIFVLLLVCCLQSAIVSAATPPEVDTAVVANRTSAIQIQKAPLCLFKLVYDIGFTLVFAVLQVLLAPFLAIAEFYPNHGMLMSTRHDGVSDVPQQTVQRSIPAKELRDTTTTNINNNMDVHGDEVIIYGTNQPEKHSWFQENLSYFFLVIMTIQTVLFLYLLCVYHRLQPVSISTEPTTCTRVRKKLLDSISASVIRKNRTRRASSLSCPA